VSGNFLTPRRSPSPVTLNFRVRPAALAFDGPAIFATSLHLTASAAVSFNLSRTTRRLHAELTVAVSVLYPCLCLLHLKAVGVTTRRHWRSCVLVWECHGGELSCRRLESIFSLLPPQSAALTLFHPGAQFICITMEGSSRLIHRVGVAGRLRHGFYLTPRETETARIPRQSRDE
jgi:hypothetical protein